MKTKQTVHPMQTMVKPQKTVVEPAKVHFSSKDQLPLPMRPIISQSSLLQLQQLYTKQKQSQNVGIEQPIGTLPSITMEAHAAAVRAELRKEKIKADLSDISFD